MNKSELEFLQDLKDSINNGMIKNDIKTVINQRIIEVKSNHKPVWITAKNEIQKVRINEVVKKGHKMASFLNNGSLSNKAKNDFVDALKELQLMMI